MKTVLVVDVPIVDIGFTCAAASLGDSNALAILKKNVASFERTWS